MKSFTLRSQLCFPKRTTPNPTANPPFLIHIKAISSHLKHPSSSLSVPPPRTTTLPIQTRGTKHKAPLIQIQIQIQSQKTCKEEFSSHVSPKGEGEGGYYSRFVILGAVTFGLVLFLMEDQKALALGPEGPLMEEFWDNMRRYALYALTVSTGVAYTLFQPILELLKNPISAILILTIFGGSFYIVSQVLNAMVGVSDFDYQYSY